MKTGKLTPVIRVLDAFSNSEIELSLNELIDRNDYFGLLHSDPDPKAFFNLELSKPSGAERINKRQEMVYKPVLFSLSDVKKTYEREVYTFMEALGDFGGFNDGILLIPAILMQIYSNKMYSQALFSLLPIKTG